MSDTTRLRQRLDAARVRHREAAACVRPGSSPALLALVRDAAAEIASLEGEIAAGEAEGEG